MVTEKTLERINELYHKSKAEGLIDPTSYILSFSSQSVHLNLKEIIYF